VHCNIALLTPIPHDTAVSYSCPCKVVVQPFLALSKQVLERQFRKCTVVEEELNRIILDASGYTGADFRLRLMATRS